ncbi:hypothetical protein M5X04_26855 [Paenibacillus alvei]|uniref:Uncharacterized protein n=1 Tax=Paenibacillus alvei TaxID=44250 RepID=A0ABT4EGQ8_PAEAL|nr:hypothetical protein [Paenibacillus alvei]MCY9532933.1 hypothetical protein [Paenibacillus alvei]
MAKLNGVKTVAEAIEYNGVKYEKINEKAQVGDILHADESYDDYVTGGAYYEVDHLDSWDDPQIIDNDGDEFDGADVKYTLFRKVTEPHTQQYREVSRKAEVGEKAKVVGGHSHLYKRGDVVVAIAEQTYVTNGVRFKREDGKIQTMVHTHGDYVVLEPIVEPSDDIVEVDGVKYREVDRDPKVGDFVYATETRNRMTQGKLYPIYEVDGDGDGKFRRDNEYSGYYPATSDGRILVERIETPADLQRKVSELQTQLAEAESKLATQKAEEEKAKDPRSAFAKGDKVRLVSGGDEHPLRGYKNGEVYNVSDPFYSYSNKIEITGGTLQTGYALPSQLVKLSEQEIAEMNRLKVGEYARVIGGSNGHSKIGDIVKVTCDDRSGCPFKTEHLDGQRAGWCYANSLIRATDEEVAEARSKLELSKISVGDYVKVLVDTEDLDEGAIGKVTRVDAVDGEWPIKVELLNGSNYDWYKPEQLEKVTEEVAQWAAIGREVGEFKVGDVVSYNGNTGGNALNRYNGIVTTIVEFNGVLNSPRYRLEKPVLVQNSSGTWARGNHLTLIAPAEAVISLAVAN